MKKIFFFQALFMLSLLCSSDYLSTQKLAPYKSFLEGGTYNGQDWSFFSQKPRSRYYTFKKAFEHFEETNGKIIVELGTTRSFVSGCFVGCNLDDPKYWEPNNPQKWDWGAGFFTWTSAMCLSHLHPEIHTVDIAVSHIQRCRLITQEFKNLISYHVSSSENFLKKWPAGKKIDLLYLDTGDITPIEPTAKLHLREAKIIIERDLLSPNGIILIDDVKHPAPILLSGDETGMGKAKYSIPYFIEHGFEVVEEEFQYILRKK